MNELNNWNEIDQKIEELIQKIVERDFLIVSLKSELNELKNNIRLWVKKNANTIESELEDIIDPINFICVSCNQKINPIRATKIFKGKPYCNDCLYAIEAERKFGLKKADTYYDPLFKES